MLPDSYDPVFQEERRQLEWDEFAGTLPVCALCQRRLYPGDKYHTVKLHSVCSYCKDELDESDEDVVEVGS